MATICMLIHVQSILEVLYSHDLIPPPCLVHEHCNGSTLTVLVTARLNAACQSVHSLLIKFTTLDITIMSMHFYNIMKISKFW